MAKASPIPTVVDIPQPVGGLNIDKSFTSQRKGTTPFSLNCRPFDPQLGRRRLSRRPGKIKYLPTQIADASIQLLDTVVVTRDQTAGTGDVFTIGGSTADDEVRLYNRATGARVTTNPTTITLAAAHSMGCSDEDNSFYVAAATASGTSKLELTKINSEGVRQWGGPVFINPLAGSGYATIAGIAAHDGVIYVWLIAKTAGSLTSPGIYRFRSDTGARIDAGVWAVTGGASPTGLVTATTITNAYQALAIGAGVLGVCGGKNSKLILQQIDTATAVVSHETDIQTTFESYPCRVTSDSGGNFYVLTNVNSTGAPTTCVLKKISHSGAELWSNTGAYGARDIAYDPTYFRLGMVGYGAAGLTFGGATGFSMLIINADTGARTTALLPNSDTDWTAIASDGLGGGFRLRLSDAASVDLHSTAPNWTQTTGAGVVTEKLWAICSGLNVAPTTVSMQSSRIVRALAVANGGLYRFDGGSVSTIAANFCSGSAPTVYSARNGLVVYFVDGNSYPTYNAETNTVGVLTAISGSVPGSGAGDRCRLICTWNGRLVMSGLRSDPQNWFMSKVDDPTDWNYFPALPSVLQAMTGSNADAGKVPEIVNTMIPYRDDLLIFGCDSSIWQMTGDPADGGRIDSISRTIGMAFGLPWCTDAAGRIYFYSSRGSIYRMAPGSLPDRISLPIDEDLYNVDLSLHRVRLAWDDRWKGLHLVISPLDKTQPTTHYWWDSYTDRSTTFEVLPDGSWWPDRFTNKNLNALAVHVFDGDDPGDRVIMFGGRDGYVRTYSDTAIDDDGSVIVSEIFIGPIQLKAGDKFYLTDMQATLSLDSEDLNWSIHPGESAEAAFNADPIDGGTLQAGRNHSQAVRVGCHCCYLRLDANEKTLPWSVDNIKVVIMPVVGTVPQRVF